MRFRPARQEALRRWADCPLPPEVLDRVNGYLHDAPMGEVRLHSLRHTRYVNHKDRAYRVAARVRSAVYINDRLRAFYECSGHMACFLYAAYMENVVATATMAEDVGEGRSSSTMVEGVTDWDVRLYNYRGEHVHTFDELRAIAPLLHHVMRCPIPEQEWLAVPNAPKGHHWYASVADVGTTYEFHHAQGVLYAQMRSRGVIQSKVTMQQSGDKWHVAHGTMTNRVPSFYDDTRLMSRLAKLCPEWRKMRYTARQTPFGTLCYVPSPRYYSVSYGGGKPVHCYEYVNRNRTLKVVWKHKSLTITHHGKTTKHKLRRGGYRYYPCFHVDKFLRANGLDASWLSK